MNKNNGLVPISILVLFLASVCALSIYFHHSSLGSVTENSPGIPATTTPQIPQSHYIPYGAVTLHVGETATFKDNSITLLEVRDESRCPTGVTCIWAGTVKAKILSVSAMGTSTETIELGKFMTTEAEKISVTAVMPHPAKNLSIKQGDYKVTFEVIKRSDVVAVTPNKSGCYIGGCSSQLCTDAPGAISNCIYKKEYACYNKTSTCERQANGSCGWTQTNALAVCLAGAL